MLMNQKSIASAPRAVALVTIVALVLTTLGPPLVAAPAATRSKGISATVASSSATDFSAARRHRHYHRRGNAARAAFAGMGSLATRARKIKI